MASILSEHGHQRLIENTRKLIADELQKNIDALMESYIEKCTSEIRQALRAKLADFGVRMASQIEMMTDSRQVVIKLDMKDLEKSHPKEHAT